MFDYERYAYLIKTNNLLLKKLSICFLHSIADIGFDDKFGFSMCFICVSKIPSLLITYIPG